MYRWENLRELWEGSCDLMFLGSKQELVAQGLTQVKMDPVLAANSMAYELDVATDLWMTKGRFTGLQRDYINPPALKEFIEKSASVSHKRVQLSQMQCRMKGQRHVSYKWGNCILGFTFRRNPSPVLTMFSRTSMITRMGGMDLALAHCIAREIAAASDEDLEDYGFVWHLSSLQHSALQGVPYFYSSGWIDDLEEYSDEELLALPALKAMKHQLGYFDRLDAEGKVSKLGTRRRVREQRRHFEKHGQHTAKLQPVPLASLNLNKIKEVWDDDGDL